MPLEERRHQTAVDVEVTGTGSEYELIAAVLQSRKDLGLSVNYADDKKKKEQEVDLYVWVYIVLSGDIWAHIEK